MNLRRRERVLTELDHARLATLCSRVSGDRRQCPAAVDDMLDDARVVPSRAVGPDIVTMYSQVLLRLAEDGTSRKLTLTYPEHAEPPSGFVSVLSPVGLGLLGQQVGATVRWASPDGSERKAELVAILFQPEASGDYTT